MKSVSGLVMCSLFLLAACGQSGPLYLPEDAPPTRPFSACDAVDAPCRQGQAQTTTPATAPAATSPATEPATTSPATTTESSTESSTEPLAP